MNRLAPLIAKTGLATGIALLLTLGTLIPGATRATAAECPEGTAPTGEVDGNPQCVALVEGETTPGPTPPPSPPSTPAPTPVPTPPPTDDPGTAPPEPAPTSVPESSPTVIVPPPATAPTPPDAPPAETQAPATTPAPTPAERSQTADEPENTGTPTPAIVAPEPPANTDTTGVIAPGDGPRLLWAVAAGASASGLLAAIVAFYLVSVRPFVIARRRPGALG